MVIQRGWKILSETGSTSASSTEANRSPGLQSSSDDSNCSMVASVASPPATKADSMMKYVTTPQMAETMLQRLRQRLGPQVMAGSSTSSESAMRSLELVRIGVQAAFDREIDWIIRRFIEEYFRPALNNLKENLGCAVVEEVAIQKMSCALLENGKGQYNAFRTKQPPLPPPLPPPPSPAAMPAQTDTTAGIMEQPQPAAVRAPLKRSATKTAEAPDACKRIVPTVPTVPTSLDSPAAQTTNSPATVTTASQPQPTVVASRPPLTAPPARRQIFWNTANISTATKFVLDVQANQAFGFGTDGAERLASKHPELIRYLPDSADRDWLIAQNIISQQNRNSRFLFLIHDEVCKLQQTPLYRNKPNVDVSIMHTFNVSDSMIQKIKLFFVDLNIKSRGLLITSSSFAMNTPQGNNSHLRNALLQGIQQQTATDAAMPLPGSNNNSNNNNSATIAAASAALLPPPPPPPTTIAATNTVSTSSEVSLSSVLKLPPRAASTLSSSHATLTALLNNSGGNSSGSGATVAPAAINDKAKIRK